MTGTSYDAVVIGAGPNGLVAANHLVDAGWSVLVLEAQPEPGGAVRSDRELHPDFVQDTFSAFYPLGAGSPVLRSLHLEQHGLQWADAPAVLGHPRPDEDWALLLRNAEMTADLFEAQTPGDGEAWLDLTRRWDAIGEQAVRALLSPFPPVRNGLGAAMGLRRAGGLDFLKELLSPATSLRGRFNGDAPHLLISGNAGHADIPLSSPGSGLLGMLLTFVGQKVGYPVPVGGAGQLTAALVRRLQSRGGELRCDSTVTRVEVDRGRAVGVRTADGERFAAGRAVLADVLASHLFGGLVPPDDVPAKVARAMRTFELDPGTVKVDWALDGPIPWAVTPAHAPGTVHVADSAKQMSEALAQVTAGVIPADPFLLMGQMTTSDPTRSPAGTESAWAYTHIPHGESPDAGDGSIKGVWDPADRERFADRMQARVERLAPGFGSRVIARRVLGPRELAARDANLEGGAVNGGTAQLHQQLVFRPVPGLGRAETGIPGLYLASASAHPGGGVHGACGMNAARAAIAHARLRPWSRLSTAG